MILRILISWACLFLCLGTFATSLRAETRVALVIGNAAYQNTAILPNPINDAEDMAAALERVGFSVMFERNLDKRAMELAIVRFARAAQNADAALFFYAGHGIQHRGVNYLMPIDARLEDEYSLQFELNRLDDVLHSLDRSRGVKILVLDSCRNNPLADRLARSSTTRAALMTRGLARIEPTRGMITAYATQSNQVAMDGAGRNSPFTSALVKQIEQPGLEIGTLFRRVAVEVNRVTQGQQLPEVQMALLGEFYLNNRDTELIAWSKVRDLNDAAALRAFIGQYPKSALVQDAHQRLGAVERDERARAEREQAERADGERAAREQGERERVDRERRAQEAERRRLEAERQLRQQVEIERTERERLIRELAARDQREREREVQEKAERDRLRKEQAERERLEEERVQQERLARAQAERDRIQEKRDDPQPPKMQTANLAHSTEPTQPQPAAPSALSGKDLVVEIKKQLKRVGCYAGPINDKWATVETISSVEKFTKYAGLSVPDYPNQEFLDALRSKSSRSCPVICGDGFRSTGDRCVRIPCKSGEVRGSSGSCMRVAEKPKKQARPERETGRGTVARPARPSRGTDVPDLDGDY